MARASLALASSCWLAIAPLAVTSRPCYGQTTTVQRGVAESPQPQFTRVGVKECAACHSNPSPIYEQLQVTSFVRLVEAKEWLERDKHAAAYEIVRPENNPLTREICQNLGWAEGGSEFVANCLTCHAGADPLKPDVDPATLRFGVQCESCHGNASEWTRIPYHQQDSWRAKTPEEKSRLGMRNLRSPSACADVCYSCHIGDVKQSRFVTHAMYAAGHPPLPPVELQTFLDAMPPHWKPLAEKPLTSAGNANTPKQFARQNEFYRANFGVAAESLAGQALIRNSFRRTQTSLIGGQVAHKFGLELIRDASQRESLWGDYALYDCSACHHELIKPTKRQWTRGRTPGRPLPGSWWNLDVETPSNQFVGLRRGVSIVEESFDKTPFGQRQMLEASLGQLFSSEKAWRETWRADEQRSMTAQQVQTWLRALVKSRSTVLWDYSTARQTGWLVQVAASELLARDGLPKEPTERLLAELSDRLQLTIAKPQKELAASALSASLQRAEDFDSAGCQRIMLELVELGSK